MPKLDLYKLGDKGVDLTNSVIHSEDGTFVAAQNAVPDRRGEAGALTKRDGLVAINSSAMSTPARGAVHVPLPLSGIGGAGGTNTVYIGLQDISVGPNIDHGWDRSTDEFVSKTTITSSPAIPASQIAGAEGLEFNTAVTINNKIYYAAGDTTPLTWTAPPQIRVWDGTVDREFVRVPKATDATAIAANYSKTVLNMIAVGTTIYLTVWDEGDTTSDYKGSVYQLNSITGVMTKLGATFATGTLPSVLAWHLGRLWVGNIAASTSEVFFIRPGIDSAWTSDETFAANLRQVTSLLDYNGKLYAGFSAFGAAQNIISVRTPGTGAWATSYTSAETGTSIFPSMALFKGKLYATYFAAAASPDVAYVVEFDGTTWTNRLNESSANAQKWWVFAHHGSLFVVQGYAATTGLNQVRVSTDGTTYGTARALGDNPTNTITATGVIAALTT